MSRTTVAIAGGNGNVGRTIVEALKSDGTYNVVVLARKAPETQADPQVKVVAVDYSDIDAVATTLEENAVHTVISTLHLVTPEGSASEINLIKAAQKASSTKRFVASDWGVPAPEKESWRWHHDVFRKATIAELRTTDLEWTRFQNGYFLDYYGLPHIESYMTPAIFAIDIANKAAGIPGNGEDIISFTYTKDVAKYVVAALGLDKWEEVTYISGDKATWNEFLKIAEEARGSKFTVAYDDVEKLERGEVTELPAHIPAYQFYPKELLQSFFSKFALGIVAGVFEIPFEGSLNQKFPDIKPKSIREVVGLWKGK